nr:Tn3 family transposase [Clostridium sp.]
MNFGSDGVIRSNNREDQRKRIKYNHLVANTIIFYNVYHMSEILHDLSSEGYDINKDIVSSLAIPIVSLRLLICLRFDAEASIFVTSIQLYLS